MRRLLLFALSLCLLLPSFFGCTDKGDKFTADGDGYGFTNAETGIHYTALDFAYEPLKGGALVGTYRNRSTDTDTAFHAIVGLDSALYVTDGQTVYFAGETPPDAKLWQVKTVYICQEDAISVEESRLTAEKNGDTVAALHALWFEGTATELPMGEAEVIRRVKLECAETPNLVYCFWLYAYADGNAYFYDLFARRAVSVPADMAALLLPSEGEA